LFVSGHTDDDGAEFAGVDEADLLVAAAKAAFGVSEFFCEEPEGDGNLRAV